MTSARHSVRGTESPRLAYRGSWAWGEFGGIGERRGRGVKGPTPRHELLFAELVADLLLVLALRRSVVALVEAPARWVSSQERSAASSARFAVRIARLRREVWTTSGMRSASRALAGALALGTALLGEGDIDPAGEEVLLVPFAFAVARQDEVMRHGPYLRTRPRAGARRSAAGSAPSTSRRRWDSRRPDLRALRVRTWVLHDETLGVVFAYVRSHASPRPPSVREAAVDGRAQFDHRGDRAARPRHPRRHRGLPLPGHVHSAGPDDHVEPRRGDVLHGTHPHPPGLREDREAPVGRRPRRRHPIRGDAAARPPRRHRLQSAA